MLRSHFLGLRGEALAIHLAVDFHAVVADQFVHDVGQRIDGGVNERGGLRRTGPIGAAGFATGAGGRQAFRQLDLLIVVERFLEELAVGEEIEEHEPTLGRRALGRAVVMLKTRRAGCRGL